MSEPVVFYSWQSDLPRASTRDVVHAAATEAVRRVAHQLRLEDAPRLDHDTLNQPGAPGITDTIFSKIKESAVFLADVSFVGTAEGREGQKAKRIPNPNVLTELGYAAGTIGWPRVILVMNKHYGSPESLPFDLRNRRFPITYTMAPKSEKPAPVEELAGALESYIRQHLAHEYERVVATLARLPYHARKLILDHGEGPGFHQQSAGASFASVLDLSIMTLLELGLVHVAPYPCETGVAYNWTYLGKQCWLKLVQATPLTLPPTLLLPSDQPPT